MARDLSIFVDESDDRGGKARYEESPTRPIYRRSHALRVAVERLWALSSVRVFVDIFDFFRQTVGNQRLHPILAAILNRLLVVPAFELQHVQRAVHLRDLRLHVGLPLVEHGLALGVSGRALRAPFHEQSDVLDLHPRLLQAFDDPKRLELRVAESANAGCPLQSREQSLLVVIPQRRDGQAEHLCHLSDCVHGSSEQISNSVLDLKSGSAVTFILVNENRECKGYSAIDKTDLVVTSSPLKSSNSETPGIPLLSRRDEWAWESRRGLAARKQFCTQNHRQEESNMTIKQTAGRDALGEFAPKFAQLNDDVLFGEVWSRQDGLSLRDRSVVTVVALMAQGLTDSSFRFHLMSAKSNGVTRTEIAEILTHAAFYAGWPKAWAAFRMAKEVWADEDDGADAKARHQNEMAFPIGAPNDAFAKYFIGQSYLAPLSTEQVGIYNVTFEPGYRNNWHTHHAKSGGGQILLCMAGRGLYQEWGKPAQELCPGDVVNIPTGVKHWHGAAPDSWFSHLAVEVPGEETSNEWLEPVDDEQYLKASDKEA